MLGPKEVHVTILRVRGAVDSLSYYLLFFQHLHSPHAKQELTMNPAGSDPPMGADW